MNPIGHDRALHYLSEGLRTDHLSPSLLFVGPDGVGKRSVALELAKCYACEEPSLGKGLPRCGKCGPCRRIEGGNHLDTFVLDRASQASIVDEEISKQNAVKIQAVRHLERFLRLRPAESKRRIAIIDDAHKMTNDAANALLKVLEEPPPQAGIILCVADEHSLPSTIRSRCAVLYFRPVAEGVLTAWLEKAHSMTAERAAEVADRSFGSFARAIELKEEEPETLDITDYNVSEFFALLNSSSFRKEGRKNAEAALIKLVEAADRNLRAGDLGEVPRLEALMEARHRIDRNVPPRLALEALFLRLEDLKKETTARS